MSSLFSLEQRVAVVTGAGNGNGAAIAFGMAQAGAKVAVVDRDGDAAQATVGRILEAGGLAKAYTLDVSDETSCQALAKQVEEELGLVNALVNNAGVMIRSAFSDPDASSALKATFGVNVHGTFYMTHAFLTALKATKGTVVNVGSIQSFVASLPSAAYAASKGAVAQLTRTLAAELAPDGIRVNAVAPGMFETAMSLGTRADPERLKAFHAHLPMRRHAKSEELIGPVVFLSSDASSYVTGAILPVDGGYLVL